MRLLPDTRLPVWLADGAPELSPTALARLDDLADDVMFSVASLWERSIEYALGRPAFDLEPRVLRRGLLDNGDPELDAAAQHASATTSLPPIHRHPSTAC